ncbi:unnamed protein product [Brassicogethes aeneus]|uniref:Carboxylesterase type B domain-containing protein n=1 Tax=Brassicogethes aeneus TaxID=1431903 RepID=A0A9P0BEV6_BRAAE|nr:unnamed protein product [Brassicogethes aeneus]
MTTEGEDIQEVKSEDKKDIEMEEREKMLNVENKAQEKPVTEATESVEDKKKEILESMEMKPKKIPIGGIQMPGFFTRSKSKDKCKEDAEQAEVEGTELINKEPENKETTENQKRKIKLPGFLNISKKSASEDADKSGEPKEKKSLIDSIRIPIVSVLSRKKNQPLDQSAQAGLASMETLDDKSQNELKKVDLEESKDEKDAEKQETEVPEQTWRQKLMAYRIAISALLLFILLIIIIIIIAVPGKSYPASPPIKDGRFIETITGCGKVEGMLEDSAFAFRGIPYARPPVGDLRFKHAQPLNRQEFCQNGTFSAHNASQSCLQIDGAGALSGAEDCLTLDVVTPKVRYDNPLPVIVLIGADSLMGGSPGKMRPSARYARSKDVVFVRPNFRLGALGFLALEQLTKSEYPNSSGNYGLSDILEALKWVQLNIEHFGGDKTSVTLFGHKAGATLVTALATIKGADKYFARAWATSGGALYPTKPLAEYEIDNKSYLEGLQCDSVDCLRTLDAKKLTQAVQDTWRKPQPDLPSPSEQPLKRHEWLVVDGVILKENPATIWAEPKDLPVKLVIGSTAQSGSSNKLLMKHTNWTEDLVKKHVTESFLAAKNLTQLALSKYPATYKGLSEMISDIRTVCPLYAITTQMHNVPFYVVTQPRGVQNISDVDSDVDAILGRYEPKTPEQRRYVSAMQNFFYHYVWQGTIEGGFTPTNRVLVVGQDVLPNSTYSHCAFWIENNVVLSYAALD